MTNLPTVVLIHGLMRTARCMKSLERRFHESGFDHTIRFGYTSYRNPLGHSATELRDILASQSSDTRFSFVGHSMGNIVVRHLIADLRDDGDADGLLPRFESMVMLGPPNQGASIARRLGRFKLFGWVAGPGAMELGPDWQSISHRLAVPPMPFAIVAGDVTSNRRLKNPLVDGDGDLLVSIDEAMLEGATVIHRVPVAHTFLMTDRDVQDWTIDFVRAHASPSSSTY